MAVTIDVDPLGELVALVRATSADWMDYAERFRKADGAERTEMIEGMRSRREAYALACQDLAERVVADVTIAEKKAAEF